MSENEDLREFEEENLEEEKKRKKRKKRIILSVVLGIIIIATVVIHRLTGDGDKKLLIAPLWSADKKRVLNEVKQRRVLHK